MLLADIGHCFTGDFSLFEDFDDLTIAGSGSLHGEAPISILSCTSTFLLGIIFGAPWPTHYDKREVAAKNDAMYYVPEIFRQSNMNEGNFILTWNSGAYNLPPAIVVIND